MAIGSTSTSALNSITSDEDSVQLFSQTITDKRENITITSDDDSIQSFTRTVTTTDKCENITNFNFNNCTHITINISN